MGREVDSILEDFNKLIQVEISGKNYYVIPEEIAEFKVRWGVGFSEDIYNSLVEVSQPTDKYMMSTHVLNHLISAPVGYEDVLNILKGKLRGEVHKFLARKWASYEKERESEQGLYNLWKYAEAP